MLWWVMNNGLPSIGELLVLLSGYAVLLFVMMPVHEMAHAWAAVKLGDNTPRLTGRLTLNPMAHLDPIGALMIVLFGIGYAKPVSVNPRHFRDPRRGMAITALAGPLANILLAILSIGVFRVVISCTGGMYVSGETLYFASDAVVYAYMVCINVFARVNLALAMFNLLPLPPLDGSRIFGALLPAKWTIRMDQYHVYLRMAVLLLVVTGALDGPLMFLEGLIGNGICFLFRLPSLF